MSPRRPGPGDELRRLGDQAAREGGGLVDAAAGALERLGRAVRTPAAQRREAAARIAELRRQWTQAVQQSGGRTRRQAQREGEVLRARYRRERLERELRAVERAQRRGQPLPTARAALGHRRAGAPAARWSALVEANAATHGGALQVTGDVPSGRDSSRIGRHWSAVQALLENGRWGASPMTPSRFERLVRGWAPVTIGGDRFRLASDPGAILAELERARALGVELFTYGAAA
jgi:hypothetical protein